MEKHKIFKTTQGALSWKERDALISKWLGKTADIQIDRPIGHTHVTQGITLHYTVNYGFLPGVLGGDGEEQDVYVLGVDRPVEHFQGQIIGVVRRRDDNEDKLVAAPAGMRFHQGEIAEQIHFVEKYFDSAVYSLFRKSCGVIPFRKQNSRTELLLVLQTNRCWSFPKGHMEAFESETDAACREMLEETGLTARLLPDFRAVVSYQVTKLIHKQVVLFLGETQGEPVIDPEEVLELRWVTIGEARQLMHPDYQNILSQVEAFL